ncbi:MAG: ATP-binding protein [Myxococcota bacterium]|jgi:two-component system phosphate regulon sensor histidine kinase PhoR|nr:ATP-binding protein [Myxococcota bacterium]
MRLGVRGKLFAAVVCLFIIAGLSAGALLTRLLGKATASRLEAELFGHAKVATLLVEREGTADAEKLHGLVKSLGAATNSRITIVDSSGVVLADSTVAYAQLKGLDNHAHRPEVRAAMKAGQGIAYRYSTTTQSNRLYVALPFGAPPHGIVRSSLTIPKVKEAIYELRASVIEAGLLALLLAIITAAVVSHLAARPLSALVEHARRLALLGKTGERLHISSADELGGLASSLNQLSDQIERHFATLASERDRFEAVLEGMSEAVVAIDEDLRVVLVNQAAVQLLGLSAEPMGKTLLEVIRVPALFELARASAQHGDNTAELELPGTSSRFLARARRQRSGGQVIVLLDVTYLRRLETIRRDFVANVSHELRTPISVIRANTETLLSGAMDDPLAARRFLESSLSHSERITRLIADLLDISRIESGNYEIELQSLPAALAIRRAIAAIEPKAAQRSISLTVEVPEDLELLADPRAFEQVVVNLLDNAIKYNHEGGRVVARVRLFENALVRLEIEDDGPGVPPAHRDRLFERFYRVDTGRSRAMGGTGLGLAIVKHLSTAMGGRVGMEPALSGGCLFWVELRRAG